ncbi:MAG: HAD family hydrolase [Pseudomonadales bacterium]
MQYKGVILDCDGVILDSNNFKISAMQESLRDYDTEKVKDFVNYFKSNFGKSRQEHIETFFNSHLNRSPTNGEAGLILANYAKNCILEYKLCAMCSGAYEFISRKSSSRLWVASGSDEVELNHVFNQRKIDTYFERILGSPTSKAANVEEIIRDSNLKTEDFCLIGDSWADYEAAKQNNVDFIFSAKYSNTPTMSVKLPIDNVRIINSLEDLL